VPDDANRLPKALLPTREYATEPEALPLEEVSLPEDPEITSLSNHGALTLEELASRISDFPQSMVCLTEQVIDRQPVALGVQKHWKHTPQQTLGVLPRPPFGSDAATPGKQFASGL
jgi:hypothetical protein